MSLPIPARLRLSAVAATTALGASVLVGLLAAAPAHAANPAPTGTPVGAIESYATNPDGSITFKGWAGDSDASTRNVTAYGIVDGHIVSRVVTYVARPRISAQQHISKTPGFALTVPVPGNGSHTVCVGVQNIGPGLSPLLKCIGAPNANVIPGTNHSPAGATTSTTATSSAVRVQGWAVEPDFVLRRLTTVVYIDGEPATTIVTHTSTAAQRKAGASPNGAFDVTVPVARGSHLVCVWLVNIGPGANSSLGCNAVDTRGPAGTGTVTTPAVNKAVVKEAKTHIGQAYVWGAEGPKTFDCSGLVMYSYGKQKVVTPRVSEAQFGAARLIPASRAVPGDLVFWHDGVGDVYHVGIYLSPGQTVAAIDTSQGVNYQKLWDTSIVTYGSFTHS